ncbi:MAG: aspartyl protease family protein [Candidatus Sulfotelmatobacter sp.]
MSLHRWFAICLSALIGVWMLVGTAQAEVMAASGDDLSCHVVPAHEPSPAEKAYLSGNASQAESLYREALDKSPHDAALTAGLARSLLRQDKVADAASTISSELSQTPNSVPLLTASAEVQYRQGKIAEAAATADQALRIDPCSPRLYLFRARVLRLNSMYSSERRAIAIAHGLDPWDMDIQRTWLGTLPLAQRVDEQKQFLAAANGMDSEERARAEKSLANLERWASNPPDKACHLVSTVSSTELPLAPVVGLGLIRTPAGDLVEGNSRRILSWGLHVLFNNNEANLAVDTGASGLLINRAIAERAGLKPIGRAQIGGVGDQSPQGGYLARADSVKVGSLEFRDCVVEVTDRKDILGMDGVIGTNVFSSYLVTLDYPMRKFLVSQLPPRTTDTSSAAVTLNTEAADSLESGGPQDRYISPTMKDYMPVFRSGHYLIVPVVLNGKASRLFMVDTGAFSTSISQEAAQAVTKVRGGEGGLVKGMSGNVAKVSFSEAITFQFAGIRQQNNDLITFNTVGLSRGAGVEISGLLGSTLLRQLTISIDYRDGLVKFDFDPRHGNHNF